MKKVVTNFVENVLSKDQMKQINGGLLQNCAVCSMGPGGVGGTCGSYSFSSSEAQSMANEFNGYRDGYSYYKQCN